MSESLSAGEVTRFGTVKRVIHTATVLHEGWEMDNLAWLVEMADGKVRLLTTSHGGLYEMSVEDLADVIEKTDASLSSLRTLQSVHTTLTEGAGREP